MAALALAPDAGAQSLEPVRTTDFGVTAGVAVPVGNGTDGLNTGFTVGGALGVRPVNMPVNMPVSFRFEATYTRLGIDEVTFADEDGSIGIDGHVSFLGGTGNVILPIPSTSSIRPYVKRPGGPVAPPTNPRPPRRRR